MHVSERRTSGIQPLHAPALPTTDAPVPMVLDTDTYNEIDDQFALAYALLSSSRLSLEAVYAAPFHNSLSRDPGDGMQRSYEEILRVLDRFGRSAENLAFEGSRQWLSETDQPVRSAAASDLVGRARAHRDAGTTLHVVAIGAPTNVASALLSAPDIADSVVVVWLGGNPTSWHWAREFNLTQDLSASHVLLDSGVPLVHVPCLNVTEHLRTTPAEVDRFVRPHGDLGAYLAEIFQAHCERADAGERAERAGRIARSKELWDVGAIAYLVDPEWTSSSVVHSPILTTEQTWSFDPRRHLIREVLSVNRDAIFGDLFWKLGAFAP